MLKKAFITGIIGQDGSHLAKFLLDKGYKVYGIVRRTSNDPLVRLGDIAKNINILMVVNFQKFNTETFSKIAKNFDVSYWRNDEENVINQYFPDKKAKLLVLGCGAGRTLPYLYKKGYEITAIDISSSMVSHAKKRCRGMKINIFVGDATDLQFNDNMFDYVFFPFHGIDYVNYRYKSINEIKRVMKRSGVLIFSSHNLLFPRFIPFLFANERFGFRIKVRENENHLWTYHTTIFEYFKLLKIFSKVIIKPRIVLQQLNFLNSFWKDKILRIFPILDKSIYFICIK